MYTGSCGLPCHKCKHTHHVSLCRYTSVRAAAIPPISVRFSMQVNTSLIPLYHHFNSGKHCSSSNRIPSDGDKEKLGINAHCRNPHKRYSRKPSCVKPYQLWWGNFILPIVVWLSFLEYLSGVDFRQNPVQNSKSIDNFQIYKNAQN